MPIIIDRTDCSNNYISDFDSSFIDWLGAYFTDVTFTDTTKRVKTTLQDATTGSWIFIKNIDMFNALALGKDLDIIVSTSLVTTYESNYQRVFYYLTNIDYNPLRGSYYAMHYMNILLNLWEGLNSPDDTQYMIGMKYADWQYFDVQPPIQCILWMKPKASGVNADKANYLRWAIDFVFMVMIDPNVVVCGGAP